MYDIAKKVVIPAEISVLDILLNIYDLISRANA
jgi:hypothetical protein